jgi:hypothetical protein
LLEVLQLRPLDLLIQAAHATARGERELLEGEELRGLLEAALQVVRRSTSVPVVGGEAENSRAVPRNETDRIEGAGSLAVVLQQETIELKLAEEALGDRIVAALSVRARATAATSPALDRCARRTSHGEACDDRVVRLD